MRKLIVVLLAIPLVQVSVHASCAEPDVERAVTSQLKVAVAQPFVIPGDVKRNVQNMQPMVAEAARRGAKLIVFSECGITGYDLKGVGMAAAIPLDDPGLGQVARIAQRITSALSLAFLRSVETSFTTLP